MTFSSEAEIKIKYAQLAKACFSVKPHIQISFMKELKISFHSELECHIKRRHVETAVSVEFRILD